MESISLGGRRVAGFSLGLGAAAMSYEEAVNAVASTSGLQPVDEYGHAIGSDLTDEQLSAPMASVGRFLSLCGAPDNMSVTVRVAVKLGQAVGVTVETSPPDSNIAACVDRSVRRLQWPPSPKLDSLVTRY